MRRLLISAAEPSGDLLAAALVRALKERGSIDAFGLAGPAMRDAGVQALANMEDVCGMGFVEVLRKLGAIQHTRATLCGALDDSVDAVVLIDAPDLHLPIGKVSRSMGIRTIGWVSPQVWAWRPGRVEGISASLDHLLCLFDFEPELYPDLDTQWVGHPVMDRIQPRTNVDSTLIGLAPGSREQETDRLLPIFIQTAEELRSSDPNLQFRLVSPVSKLTLPDWIERGPDIQSLSSARAVLTKSGTVTLELAVMGVPQVVAHQVHPITYWLGRRLVRGIQHIAMPNILAKDQVVPEFVQNLKPHVLADALQGLPEHQAVNLSALGDPGATRRTADIIHAWIQETP
ncbi:MAG: lipid-A-disaccharide synthase [Deltaproteobacteria bacterium]|nr:lipid-A-disaccharide synthase [Deltaproteobacteria bacterium]